VLHPIDESLSLGTPVLHPIDESLSLGTPVLHPIDEDLSLGTPVLPRSENPDLGHPAWPVVGDPGAVLFSGAPSGSFK